MSNSFVFPERSDLRLPCVECHDKTLSCRDSCGKYAECMELRRKMNEDRQKRMSDLRYDRESYYRRNHKK